MVASARSRHKVFDVQTLTETVPGVEGHAVVFSEDESQVAVLQNRRVRLFDITNGVKELSAFQNR